MFRKISFNKSFENSILSKVFVSQEHPDFEFPLIDVKDIVKEIRGGAVCIAADSASDILSGISRDIDSEVRQYILIHDKKSASRVNAGKYVRITKHHQYGMAVIHVDGKDFKSWLFPSQDSTRAYAVEGDVLYRSFCNLFWSHDIVCEFRGNNIERPADSPFSQDLKLKDTCSLPDNLPEIFSRYPDGSFYASDPKSDFLDSSDISGYDNLYLVFDKESAAICSKASCAAYLFNKNSNGSFSMITNGHTGYLLPERIGKAGINWSIALNQNGCKAFESAFDVSWEYNETIPVKKVVDSDVFYPDNIMKIIHIAKKKSISDSYRCQDLDQYFDDVSIETSYLSKIDSSRPVALSVNYDIKALPPVCPKNAKKDPLYDSWGIVLKSWKDSLDILRVKCDNFFKDAVPAAVDRTANESVLEKEHDDLIKEIGILSGTDISIESEKQRTRHVESYQTLCSKVESFTVKCLELQKKREFETDKRQGVQKLESEIGLAKDKIKNKKDSFSSCEESMKKLDDRERMKIQKKYNS